MAGQASASRYPPTGQDTAKDGVDAAEAGSRRAAGLRGPRRPTKRPLAANCGGLYRTAAMVLNHLPEDGDSAFDATDDPTHGVREKSIFHDYYDRSCSLPLDVSVAVIRLSPWLGPSHHDATRGPGIVPVGSSPSRSTARGEAIRVSSSILWGGRHRISTTRPATPVTTCKTASGD